MRVGIVLFGDGKILADGSVKPAIEIEGLVDNLDDLKTKAAALPYQRGLTNMAQAFVLADIMLQRDGRPEAQSAVVVLSDGKYSFEYRTRKKAQELKDKNIDIFMAPITETRGMELNKLKAWASQPWESNYVRIPGFKKLKAKTAYWATKLLAKFCPMSYSPSSVASMGSGVGMSGGHSWWPTGAGDKPISDR